MAGDGHRGADLGLAFEVDLREAPALAVAAGGHDRAPRVDHAGSPVRAPQPAVVVRGVSRLLRRRTGPIMDRETVSGFGRTVTATAAMAAVTVLASLGLDSGAGWAWSVASLLVLAGVGDECCIREDAERTVAEGRIVRDK